jgi:hypothetical protein
MSDQQPTLNGTPIGERHRYLRDNRPEFERSLRSIVNEGGPWPCGSCNAPSYLCYRCSMCGRDLAGEGSV